MGVKAQKAETTRANLIAAARTLFARDGYSATGTEAILAAAGVTRGALYHHFADKQALFAAVCAAIHEEIEGEIDQTVEAASDPLAALKDGCLAFLDYMVRPDVRRILILEAPGVLGWAAWNEMDRRHGFGQLIDGVRVAVEAGVLEGDVESIAVLLNGALNYGVVWAGQSGDAGDMDRLKMQFLDLMDRLRA